MKLSVVIRLWSDTKRPELRNPKMLLQEHISRTCFCLEPIYGHLSFRGVHHFSGPIEFPSCRHQWRQIWQWLSQRQHEKQALEWRRVARRFAVTAHRVKQLNWQAFEWFLNEKHRKQDWNFASSIPTYSKLDRGGSRLSCYSRHFCFQQHLPLPPKGSWGILRQGEIYNLLIEVWAVPGKPPKGGSQEAL